MLSKNNQQKLCKVRKYDCVINGPIGKLGLIIANDQIAKIDFLSTKARLISPKTAAARKIASEIKKYFSNPKMKFNLAMHLEGTALQKKIWVALQKIPSGKTATYGELAQKLGTGPRIIGNACRRNPVPIIIPCHRVVAVSGLGGYCGQTKEGALETKEWLLRHENKNPSV